MASDLGRPWSAPGQAVRRGTRRPGRAPRSRKVQGCPAPGSPRGTPAFWHPLCLFCKRGDRRCHASGLSAVSASLTNAPYSTEAIASPLSPKCPGSTALSALWALLLASPHWCQVPLDSLLNLSHMCSRCAPVWPISPEVRLQPPPKASPLGLRQGLSSDSNTEELTENADP